MSDYQHVIRLGYKEGKWTFCDERTWVELDSIEQGISYLKEAVRATHEGEIAIRKKNGKWYMRDVSKVQGFPNTDEMTEFMTELDRNYQEEIINKIDAYAGKKKAQRNINVDKILQGAAQKERKAEAEVKKEEAKNTCDWHRDAEMVAICAGCNKKICEKCVARNIEDNYLCNSCWTQYKYSRQLEKFRKK